MKVVPVSIVIPIRESKEVWLQKRLTKDFLHGSLEFPGGKVEANETPLEAAGRELKEEVGVELDLNELSLFDITTHHYDKKSVKIYVFLLSAHSEKFGNEGWFQLSQNWREELIDKVPAANHGILDKLHAILSSA